MHPIQPRESNSHSARQKGVISVFDRITELVLFGMILFSPWAFGTTEPWSVRVMNFSGAVLGGVFLLKCIARRSVFPPASGSLQKLRTALLIVIGLILGYVLAASWNAEFTYIPTEFRRDPHPHVSWLPHTLDRLASWQVFRNWLALAAVFWAAHDWFASDEKGDGSLSTRRLRRLIFLLAFNGGLVALEGIFQRSSGTARLLWFQPTHDNPIASAQFGPYAYRANAAQFFNLVWPPALALWWHLYRRNASARRQKHHWLLPFIILLIVAPLVSASRGGVAVALLQMGACGAVLLAKGRLSGAVRFRVAAVFLVTLAAAVYLGGNEIAKRLHETSADPLLGRAETYRFAARMMEDYPWFGVGPGAFDSVFQVYRNTPDDYWPLQLHNDWLEYLITFGRVGSLLLVLAGALVAVRWWLPGGLRMSGSFMPFVWIAIGGCLLHARFDFPLQIYSIQLVFVLLGAVLFSLSRSRMPKA